MISLREYWPSHVPVGAVGNARVERFEVSRTHSMMTGLGHHGGFVPEGFYTRLIVGGELMMSDTPEEYRTNLPILRNATGHVLIHGLGLGCVLACLRHKPDVTAITVIEKSQDVIDLVAREFPGVEVIHADALTWAPERGMRFDAVWHDIWPNICTDNIPAVQLLNRRYGRRADWQGAWAYDQLKAIRQRDAREKRRFAWLRG